VLTEALVSRILFGDDEAGKDLTATGVEFFHGGKAYVVHVQKEIILSAGQVYGFVSTIEALLTIK
jgi:hypothetical protein